MAGRPIFAIISIILLLAACLFELFVILSGYIYATPFGRTYFLSAATANLPGNVPSSPRVAWTYLSLASIPSNGAKMTNHMPVRAAFPFQPRQNFDLSGSDVSMLPQDFQTGNYYYYMSRFAWVFYLIALFFGACALVTGLLAMCSRIGGYLSGFLASIATFFMAITAALMTAWTVQARNAFNRNGDDAQLGRYAYGFTWAAFACYFLCMILFCVSGSSGGKKEATYKEKKGFFGRNKENRKSDGIRSEYS